MTANVASMCTNMIKEEVLESVEKLLKESFIEVNRKFPAEDLLKMIKIILENNMFQFNHAYLK